MFNSKQICRAWVFDNQQPAEICNNLTQMFQRTRPGSFVTWDFAFGSKGNTVFKLWWRD